MGFSEVKNYFCGLLKAVNYKCRPIQKCDGCIGNKSAELSWESQ